MGTISPEDLTIQLLGITPLTDVSGYILDERQITLPGLITEPEPISTSSHMIALSLTLPVVIGGSVFILISVLSCRTFEQIAPAPK
jgi:hypothetical protein